MALSGIIDTIYTQLYAVLIGKLFSTRELGYYTRAESTQQLPVGVLTRVLNRVALPILSEAAVDTSYLTRGVRKILVTTMLINVPIMLGLAVLAEQLVVTLFGVKWLPSVPFLQVLCLAGVIWPLHVINLNALMAQGRSDLFFRIEMIKKLVGIPLLVLASWHSILAIAWAVVVQGLFAFLINAHYSKMLLGYGALRQVQDVVPYVGVGLLMTVSVWWGSHVLDFPPAAELAILSIVGAAVYFLSCYLLHLAAVEEVVAVIKRGSRS
jgi:O-antigen/teichoic acid export membrane protein